MVSKYVCPVCDTKCVQPYVLRDHFKNAHGKIVTLEYAKEQVKLYRNVGNPVNKKPKVIRKKMTCKCGTVCSGNFNFKRHVETKHGMEINWINLVVDPKE